MTAVVTPATTTEAVAAGLDAARRRSLDLLLPVSEADQMRQHSPLMSPLAWDLAHVANYEELWLVRALAGLPAARPELDDLYDAFRHTRATRAGLPILGPREARSYAADVRGRVLEVLAGMDGRADGEHPLLLNAFVFGMVIQHEHQHDETMLATLQLMDAPGYLPLDAPMSAVEAPAVAHDGGAPEVLVPGGEFVMGTDTDPWALDNERPAHDGRRSRLPHRPLPGHQRPVRGVHRRRWL